MKTINFGVIRHIVDNDKCKEMVKRDFCPNIDDMESLKDYEVVIRNKKKRTEMILDDSEVTVALTLRIYILTAIVEWCIDVGKGNQE